MKSVLFHINDDLGQESRLQVSLDLVRALAGHLQCVEALPLPPYVDDELAIGLSYSWIALQLDAETGALLEKRRRSLQDRMEAEGLPWDWISRHGDAADIVTTQARLADIVVLSHAPEGERYQHPLPLVGQVLMNSRTAVLAVPERWPSLNVAGRALVAWDGSAESAAALRQSVPLLRLAELVVVATVSDEQAEFPPLDAAMYLSRHGVSSELRPCSKDGTVADTLINLAGGLEAAYIVMGAYGHGRVTEYLFGGTTRRMLQAAAFPILVAR